MPSASQEISHLQMCPACSRIYFFLDCTMPEGNKCLLGSRVGWAVRLGSMCGVIRIHGAPGELETAALKAASCPPGPGRQAGGRAGAGVRRAAGALCHVPGLLRTCGHWAGAVLKSVLGEHRGQVGLLSTCKGPGVGQAPADSRGQGSLACRSPWGRRVSHD